MLIEQIKNIGSDTPVTSGAARDPERLPQKAAMRTAVLNVTW
jgi:hypothetical protein